MRTKQIGVFKEILVPLGNVSIRSQTLIVFFGVFNFSSIVTEPICSLILLLKNWKISGHCSGLKAFIPFIVFQICCFHLCVTECVVLSILAQIFDHLE